MNINILIRIKKLLDLQIEGIDTLESVLNSDKSIAGEEFKSLTDKPYEIGDLIFVSNDLVEIVELVKSDYGYSGFKVKYLGSRIPIAGIDEDYFPSKFIQTRILKKKDCRNLLEKMLIRLIEEGDQFKEDFRKLLEDKSLNDEEIYNVFKKVFIDLHNSGILIKMYQIKV